MTTSVIPRSSLICLSSFSIERVVLGSRADVASSQSMTSGSDARALAIATLCFCPPDSCDGNECALSSRSTTLRSSSARALASAFGTPAISIGKQIFPMASLCIRRLNCWKIMEILRLCRLRSLLLSPVRTFPSNRTLPSVGCSRRLMVLTRVDFPAPESPMMPKESPLSISRLMSFSATTLPPLVPNSLVTPCRLIIQSLNFFTSAFAFY